MEKTSKANHCSTYPQKKMVAGALNLLSDKSSTKKSHRKKRRHKHDKRKSEKGKTGKDSDSPEIASDNLVSPGMWFYSSNR